jgi:hypothetical protein
LSTDSLGIAVDRAPARVVGAPLREVVEGELETLGLTLGRLGGGLLRVDRAVKHHGADLVGEQLGVDRSQQRAVGEAEISQLWLAEVGANLIDVAGRLLGRVEREPVAVFGGAALGSLLVERDHLVERLLRLRVGVGGERRVKIGAAIALDRIGATHPARIKPNEVESAQHLGRHALGEVEREVDTRSARAAWVDEQGSRCGRAGRWRAPG